MLLQDFFASARLHIVYKIFLPKCIVHYLYHLKSNNIISHRKTPNTEKHFYPWLISFNLKSDSHVPKKFCFICFNESSLKLIKNAFYFILTALFVLKIFKFLSRLFGHVGKTAWLERYDLFQNLWHHSLVNKQLQYAYYPMSHEVKATRHWNLVSL